MTNEHDNEFFDGLFYEDMLPLEWSRLEGEPDRAYLAHLNESNDDMLRMLAIMEEHFSEKIDEGANFAAEILRLEAKVNLLLDMVGQILANHLMLPEQVPVRLGSRGIEFAHTQPPGANELVLLTLYLQQRYPRPLELIGRVVSVEDSGQGAYWVRAKYEHLSSSVQDWLEKFIFRRHRRLVAHSRSGAPSA
jgi:hypothetical protein